MRVHEEVQKQLLEILVISEYAVRRFAETDTDDNALFVEGCLHEFERLRERRPHVDGLLRSTSWMRQRTEAIDDALHAVDLAADDPSELADELRLTRAPRQQLRECLDRHQWVLDLVRDTRGEHFEVGESLGAPALDLELLQGREIAEDRHGSEHGAVGVSQRRCRADHRPHAIRPGQFDLRQRACDAVGGAGQQRRAQAVW